MHYDYVALPDRKPLKWPGGHRVAMIFTLNLEYWEFLRDGAEPFYPGGPASIPHMLPGNVAGRPSRHPRRPAGGHLAPD